MITITVRPEGRSQFSASVEGKYLCTSKQPFYASARILKARGVPDDTPIEMQHAGSQTIALRSTVGKAAGKMVVEDKNGIRVRPWTPPPSGSAAR